MLRRVDFNQRPRVCVMEVARQRRESLRGLFARSTTQRFENDRQRSTARKVRATCPAFANTQHRGLLERIAAAATGGLAVLVHHSAVSGKRSETVDVRQ